MLIKFFDLSNKFLTIFFVLVGVDIVFIVQIVAVTKLNHQVYLMKNKIIIVGLAALLSSGCSTIVNGGNEQLTFSSQEEKTQLFVNGKFVGNDVATLELPRGKKHAVIAKKDGCTMTTLETDYSFQWGKSLLANVLIDWGIISIPTDLITGAAWESNQKIYEVTPNCPLS